MTTLTQTLLSMVFPRKPICPVCQKSLYGNEYVCGECLKSIAPLMPPLCEKCGRPLAETGRCHDCGTHLHRYDQARSFGEYRGALKKLIYVYKYRGHRELAPIFGELLRKTLAEQNWFSVDCIVPTPLHPKRLKERGFNQALLLANQIGGPLKIPVSQGLRRVKNTKHQTLLDKYQREKNLEGAFDVIRKREFAGKTVLLIDDVYTTGATSDACAMVLKESGARSVNVLTIARG